MAGLIAAAVVKPPLARSDLAKIMHDLEIEKGTMVSMSVRCYRSQYT